MAEHSDKADKTEEPTEKRIQDAINEGNTAVSREVIAFASIVSMLAVLGLILDSAASAIYISLRQFFDQPDGMYLTTPADVVGLFISVGRQSASWLLAIVATLAVGGLAGAFIQNSPKFVGKRIKPDPSRISIMKGAKRIFGAQGLFEFFKAIFKFSVMIYIGYVLGTTFYDDLVNAMYVDALAMPQLIFDLAIYVLASVTLAVAVLAAADYAWSRYQWRSNLMMTRQEIKDEIKQSEGDPIVKSRLRSLALDRARRRMMAAVPRSTMVIMNPTHYAVALRYVRAEGGAPTVLAKGRDFFALKIREIAEANDIPIYEDKLLARSLYKSVEIDKAIPSQFYKAIAEIYLFIERRKASWKRTTGR